MKWAAGAVILVVVGAVLRRLLRLGRPAPRRAGSANLFPELHAVYHPVAQELGTHAAILGISLNDAFEERDAHRLEMAWRMVRLSAGEWDRLVEMVTGLLNALAKYLPTAHAVVPVRRILANHFMSQVMVDYLRMHELLDQLVFSSKQRFQLQIRLLTRATATLTREFRRTWRYGEQTHDPSAEVWNRLDFYFHDFDLVAKETLLAFHALLTCLPPESIPQLAADLRPLLQRGVRTPPTPAVR